MTDKKEFTAETWAEWKEAILQDFKEIEKLVSIILYGYEKEKGIKDSDKVPVGNIFRIFKDTFSMIKEKYNDEYILVANSQLYQNFRSRIATGDFQLNSGEKWPVADISGRALSGRAYMMPDREAPIIGDQALQELQEAMKEKVLDLTKRGDLAADVFDAITGKWLKEARQYKDEVFITADDILEARGLQAKLKEEGRRGGYELQQRADIQHQINTLSYAWINVKEMDVIQVDDKGRRKKEKWRGESKAIILTDRFGQVKLDGSIDARAWKVRPGNVFAEFLFGPGRQTALLSQKALNYDPYRQKWEKRLARYLAWLWRISSGRTKEGLLIKTLIEAAGMKLNKSRPGRTRERLEEALDRLQQDNVITAWEYEHIDESIFERRGWAKKWLDCKVTITAPPLIIEQYRQLNEKRPQK